MPRRNHPKNVSTRSFDVIDMYEPTAADVRKIISLPRKTIFINRAAKPDAKVIRVSCADDDLYRMPLDN